MSEAFDAIFDRMEAAFDRIDALLLEIIDHLDRRQNVPLHQRGFGVMDGSPA
jgi:hypothetical protein